MEAYVLWVPYVVLTILSFILLCVSFLRYRTRKLKKKHYQAFLIRRKNELHLIEQGLYEYNARVDSIYSLGEIVRVFKYKDARNVIKIYPELLSVENQSVVVKVEDGALETCKEDNEPTKKIENKETETIYKKESKVIDKRQRPFSTTSRNTCEERELEDGRITATQRESGITCVSYCKVCAYAWEDNSRALVKVNARG